MASFFLFDKKCIAVCVMSLVVSGVMVGLAVSVSTAYTWVPDGVVTGIDRSRSRMTTYIDFTTGAGQDVSNCEDTQPFDATKYNKTLECVPCPSGVVYYSRAHPMECSRRPIDVDKTSIIVLSITASFFFCVCFGLMLGGLCWPLWIVR